MTTGAISEELNVLPAKLQPERAEANEEVCTTHIPPPRRGPSGPRKAGEGVEEEDQEVVSTEVLPGGAVQIRVTLLAAGFIIGASGASVREIMQTTGAIVQSWTQQAGADGYRRPTRVFRISGPRRSVQLASEVIVEAVERYKELCEGKRRGEFVQRQQKIRGVEFAYQPPPRSAAPHAASLGASTAATNWSKESEAKPRRRRSVPRREEAGSPLTATNSEPIAVGLPAYGSHGSGSLSGFSGWDFPAFSQLTRSSSSSTSYSAVSDSGYTGYQSTSLPFPVNINDVIGNPSSSNTSSQQGVPTSYYDVPGQSNPPRQQSVDINELSSLFDSTSLQDAANPNRCSSANTRSGHFQQGDKWSMMGTEQVSDSATSFDVPPMKPPWLQSFAVGEKQPTR